MPLLWMGRQVGEGRRRGTMTINPISRTLSTTFDTIIPLYGENNFGEAAGPNIASITS